jgi:hypothetical protein
MENHESEKPCVWCGDEPRLPGKVCCKKASCARKYEKFLDKVKRVLKCELSEGVENPPGFIYEDEKGDLHLNINATPENLTEARLAFSGWRLNPPPSWTPIQKVEMTEEHKKENAALFYLVLMAQGNDVFDESARATISRRKEVIPDYDEMSYLIEFVYGPF